MTSQIDHLKRRDVLKDLGFGALGLALGGKPFGPAAGHAAGGSRWVKRNGLFRAAGQAKVALIRGDDRQEITYQALKKIEDDVLASIRHR